MSFAVSLKEVTGEIDVCPGEWRLYLSRVTGEILTVAGEDYQEEKEWREMAERVESAPEDFVMLPRQQDLDEYQIMERFCATVEDERKRERLEDAISGKGAFRRFKDMIAELGVRDGWFAFKEQACADEVREFLEAKGVPFVDDVARV